MDDELRAREEKTRESDSERMRSRTGDSVHESAPPRSRVPEDDRVSLSRASEELPTPTSAATPLGPPLPDPDLDGSSVSPSSENEDSSKLRARLAERDREEDIPQARPRKRLCRLIPLAEPSTASDDQVGPPQDIDADRLAALERMAAEKGCFLEWYDADSASSASSRQQMGGEVEAWQMRRSSGAGGKEIIYYHPYPSDEELGQIRRYQSRVTYSKEAAARRYFNNDIDRPRSRSAKAFREIQDRAAIGRAGRWPTEPRKFPIPTLPEELSKPSDPPPAPQGEYGWSSLTERWRWYPREEAEQPSASSLDKPPGDVGTVGQSQRRNDYLQEMRDKVLSGYLPPGPEHVSEVTSDAVDKFLTEAKAAYDKGVWQTDSSHHARDKVVNKEDIENGATVLEPQPGKRTLRMAYFFSGV